MSQDPSSAVGQVSADGQFRWDGTQWVPIPPGTREATPWTRPMQLAAAALFILATAFSVVTAVIYVNHDTIAKVLKAQGTQIPAGTSVDTVITISIVTTFAIVGVIAVIELLAALGSLLRWRWIFWPILVLFGLSSLGALFNLSTLSHPDTSPYPTSVSVVSELLSIASVAMFVWLLMGLIRFGPWAMKKPGR